MHDLQGFGGTGHVKGYAICILEATQAPLYYSLLTLIVLNSAGSVTVSKSV